MTYADDLDVGATIALGSFDITRDEIVAFAQTWDPQWFHVDDEVAASGYFGEVIASGVQSVAILTRLCVLGAYNGWALLAGRGMQDLRFPRPVRPGMRLVGELTIVDVDMIRDDRATVTVAATLHCDGRLMVSLRTVMDVWRRSASQGELGS